MVSARDLTIAAAACLAAAGVAACTGKASKATASSRDVPRAPGVYVQPPSVTVLPSSTVHFHVDVVGLSTTAVTWSLEPTPCGTLTPAGGLADYVAPSTVGSVCTVRARSVGDTSKSGVGTVTVTADLSSGAPGGTGHIYEVGAGHTYATIGAVPWYSLGPGDDVLIYPGTYHEKFLISTSGSPSAWIRVRGVPDANGNLPVISGAGATTSTNMRWRWPEGSGQNAVQPLGIVSLAVGAGGSSNPAYVEIANLQIQDGNPNYSFTTEANAAASYTDFTACIYTKAPRHLLVRDNVLTNCGQGFYVWTGSGANTGYYDQLAADVTLRNNYIHHNGWSAWTSHQVYTECDGIVIEGNRFGPVRSGALGNQVKDRSAGSVIRYNYFEEAPESGYFVDLVEPQEGCPSLCYTHGATISPNRKYQQAFVYGNVFVRSLPTTNFLHWNEDHQDAPAKGRAAEPNGRLFFYDNTIVDTSGQDLLFNQTYGAYECPAYDLPGRVVFTNNIVYSSKGTYTIGEYCYRRPVTGQYPNQVFDTHVHGSWDFGPNWISRTASFFGSDQTGFSGVTSPAVNDPGFTDAAHGDYTLTDTSGARTIGGDLPAVITQVSQNDLGLDLTPTKQYVLPHPTSSPTPKLTTRPSPVAGRAVGAFDR